MVQSSYVSSQEAWNPQYDQQQQEYEQQYQQSWQPDQQQQAAGQAFQVQDNQQQNGKKCWE